MNTCDALRQMVREYPGGAEALLPRIAPGKSLQVFEKELRGTSPGHKMCQSVAATIAELCTELGLPSASAYASAVARRSGGTFKPAASSGPAAPWGVLGDLNAVLTEFSDVVRVVSDAGVDGDYSLNELRRIEREAGEAQLALQKLVRDVEAAYRLTHPQGDGK